jgi:hypothetical protein
MSMPTLRPSDLMIDADAVLRGQGADPAIIRARKPALVQVAEEALRQGRPLLKPEVFYRRLAIEDKSGSQVELAGGGVLSGVQVAGMLSQAEQVIVAVATVGPEIDTYAGEVFKDDVVQGLALDGVGSAAVEALANWACRGFEEEAAGAGLQTTVPLNPGMIGWPIEVGQPEIFALLDEPHMSVTLNEYAMMQPGKSLSLVVGVGAAVRTGGIVCDTCGLRDTCRYRLRPEEIRPQTLG